MFDQVWRDSNINNLILMTRETDFKIRTKNVCGKHFALAVLKALGDLGVMILKQKNE